MLRVSGAVIELHGHPYRIVAVCRVYATGTQCSARMQRFDARRRRWVFTRWTLCLCGTARFEYCRRRDRTRNLRVEAIECEAVPRPPPRFYERVPRLTPELEELRRDYAGYIAGFLYKQYVELKEEVDDGLRRCLDMFGLRLIDVEVGYSWEEYSIERCCYDRCASTRTRCFW